jgi:synaptotagmin-7
MGEASGDESESNGDTPPQSASIAGSAPLLGRIQIHLRYDFERMTLNLRLMGAEHLPAKDFSGTSDPYVKIMLLPDRKQRLVSNIRRKCLNPRWDEMFSFEGELSTLTIMSTSIVYGDAEKLVVI